MACPGQVTSTEGRVRIKQKSWNNNYIFWRRIGSEIKAERRVRKRRWWCLWLCKTWGWSKWDALNLSLTTRWFDSDARFITDQSNTVSNDHKIHHVKTLAGLTSTKEYGPTGQHERAEGVQAHGSGRATIWRLPGIVEVPYDMSSVVIFEHVNTVSHKNVCTGKGQQPD